MNYLSAKCPNCSANLTVDPKQDYIKCNFCSSYVKVRDSLIIKLDTDNPNLLRISQEFLESGNINEANQYVNKVLESDPDNYLAWKTKSLIIFSAVKQFYGSDYELSQALHYAIKSVNLAPDNLKQKLREEFSCRIIGLNPELKHSDFIETAYRELNTNQLLIHLADIYINSLYRKIAIGESCSEDFSFKLDSLIKRLRESDIKSAEQKLNEFKTSQSDALVHRKKYLKKIYNRHYTNSFYKWLVYSLIIVSFLALIFSMGYLEMCIASFIVLFCVSYLFFYMTIRARTSRDEKKIYGDVLIYR
jgi:tetratricopeptide (TPR) repeat protein